MPIMLTKQESEELKVSLELLDLIEYRMKSDNAGAWERKGNRKGYINGSVAI